MPLSVLTNFSPAQVEAILRHELAHIRRNDYIVNMLQSIAEIIFFFNPSVWWISSLIRDEREHCCDDLAVNGNMNKRVFVEALLSFQEYQLAHSYAQGFAGPRYKMLHDKDYSHHVHHYGCCRHIGLCGLQATTTI
jgi:bla regulator protein blaR1